MSNAARGEVGAVASLWRYPVKSMQGEALETAQVGVRGVLGDRAYGLIDSEDGKVATAKNPRKWPNLFAFRATFVEPPSSGAAMPPVGITLPDGSTVTSSQNDANALLSKALNRPVTLAVARQGQVAGVHSSIPAAWSAFSEEYWLPDVEGLAHSDAVTDFALPEGTFFDGATLLLVSTATLKTLHDAYPQGRFEIPRFRPNIMVDAAGDFPENDWIGHILAIGDVLLIVEAPCGRCVMTTLAQGDLPKDSGILRTAVKENHGHVGVYASVMRGGSIRPGDRICLEA